MTHFQTSRAASPQDIVADLGRDATTGIVHGTAGGTIDAPPELVYAVLTQAVHGHLSKRTKICLAMPKEAAEAYLVKPSAERLGVRGKISDQMKKEVLAVASGEPPAGVSPRVDVMYAYRFMEMPPLVPDQWFVARETHDAAGASEGKFSVRIEAIAGNIRHYDARWSLSPVDGGKKTRAELVSDTDVGFSGPEFLLKLGKSELKDSVLKVRELVRKRQQTGSPGVQAAAADQSTPTEK